MSALTDFPGDEHSARIVLACVARPGEAMTGRLVQQFGAIEALRLADSDDPVPGVGRADAEVWRGSLRATVDPRMLNEAIAETDRQGFRVVIPGDPERPSALDDLGHRAPYALWANGRTDLLTGPLTDRVTVTGARAATAYGEHVAADVVRDLVADHHIIVSGASYGIDAAAHKGALAADGGTIAVMANGFGRAYPAGHAELLEQISHEGLLLSELPPSEAPNRQRFLDRHRVLAALSGATVVIEAGPRSGALGVVNEAGRLGREVGAVPGPVTSAASRGTNLLLRERTARAILGGEDAIRLVRGNASQGPSTLNVRMPARSTAPEPRTL